MTVEELAGAVGCLKNLAVTRHITPTELVDALWSLVDEACESPHYVPGTSKVVDALLKRIGNAALKRLVP